MPNAPARAAALGVVAGMRSQMPLFLLALAANRGSFAEESPRPLSLLRSRVALACFGLAAAGEMIGDKLPVIPGRLQPGPLAGRLAVGGLAGAMIFREAERPALLGALVGAAGAGLGAAGGHYGRAVLGSATGAPDVVWGIAEDALALGLGIAALR